MMGVRNKNCHKNCCGLLCYVSIKGNKRQARSMVVADDTHRTVR